MNDNSRIEQLETILSGDPANQLALYALGMEYSAAGMAARAVATFARLIEANPEYVNAYFMAAQTLHGAEDFAAAKEYLRKGIECAQRNHNQHAEDEMQALLDEMEG
jgi:tetratricopeptide (TPR) repeat protein